MATKQVGLAHWDHSEAAGGTSTPAREGQRQREARGQTGSGNAALTRETSWGCSHAARTRAQGQDVPRTEPGLPGPNPRTLCSPVRFPRSSLALKADTRPHCQPSQTTTCPRPVPGTEGRGAWTPPLAAAGTRACQARGREPQTCPGTTGRTRDWPGPPRVDPVPPGRETGRGSLTPPPGRPSTGRLQTKPSPVSGAVTDPDTARVHESLLCPSVTSGL